jgi:hypothetical protein
MMIDDKKMKASYAAMRFNDPTKTVVAVNYQRGNILTKDQIQNGNNSAH